MARAVLFGFDGGLAPGARLRFSGPSPRDSYAIDWLDAAGNVVFHFNPRPDEQIVVLNSFIDGSWGEEVKIDRFPFSVRFEVPLALGFDILPDRFVVSNDGTPVGEFPHRSPPETIDRLRSTIFLWRLEADGVPRVARWRGRRGRSVAPRVRPTRTSSADGAWISATENPPSPERLESFRLFAILSTWMEEDVVAASVANAFRQGCERVYLVDNGSRDRTVERAVAAGAILGRRFESRRYDEFTRIAEMQRVVDEVSTAEGDAHIWWLWVDADEFHHGPGGLTLQEYLATLDRSFRIVGARFFNHLPDREPAYVEGRHPLDCQPLCYEIADVQCDLAHSNHPLQRWDRDGARVSSGPGSHKATCAEPLLEPTVAVFFHHFPYRARETTERRLRMLFGEGGVNDRVGSDPFHGHLRLRLRSLDAIYRQRWQDVAFFPPCIRGFVPELRLWEECLPSADHEVARWY